MKAEGTRISELNDQHVSAVAFVQDYVEFHFDGKILRSLSEPVVSMGRLSWRFPAVGARDALCTLIGKPVADVHVFEGDRIELDFGGGTLLAIPLSESARTGEEAAHYVSGENGPIEVW